MATEIYDSLTDGAQAKINAIVASVKEHLSVDGEVDLDLLMATLEQLNEAKKQTREMLKERDKKTAEAVKLEKAALAKEYVASLKIGDNITFEYGPASFRRQATLPIEKVGAQTVQVCYTPDMIVGKSITNKRNIRYEKIVVPADFAAQMKQSA